MNEINLDAHYTNNPKVTRPINTAVNAPVNIPKPYSFNDKEANLRMKAINQDIYIKSKKEDNKTFIKFLKVFGAIVGGVLLIKGIKNIITRLRKH